jgi:hypothetical protein
MLRDQPKLALTEAYNEAFHDDDNDEQTRLKVTRKTLLAVEWDTKSQCDSLWDRA